MTAVYKVFCNSRGVINLGSSGRSRDPPPQSVLRRPTTAAFLGEPAMKAHHQAGPTQSVEVGCLGRWETIRLHFKPSKAFWCPLQLGTLPR